MDGERPGDQDAPSRGRATCGIGVPLVFRGDCQEPPMGSIQSKPRVAYDHARRRPKTRILGVTACDEATAFRDDGRVVAIVAHSSSHAPPSR